MLRDRGKIKLIFITFSLAIFFTVFTAAASSTCPVGYQQNKNSCFRFGDSKTSYQLANEECLRINNDSGLADFTDEDTHDFITAWTHQSLKTLELLQTSAEVHQQFWIGTANDNDLDTTSQTDCNVVQIESTQFGVSWLLLSGSKDPSACSAPLVGICQVKLTAASSPIDPQRSVVGAPCKDKVEGWIDKEGLSCADYYEKAYCTAKGGFGVGWQAGWGSFDLYGIDGVDAAQVCCQCGGGAAAETVEQRIDADYEDIKNLEKELVEEKIEEVQKMTSTMTEDIEAITKEAEDITENGKSGEIPGHPSQESEPTESTQTSPLQSQNEETEMTDESKINVPDEIMTQQNSIPQVANDAKVVVPAERVHKTTCQDTQGWIDSYGYSCADYAGGSFCTSDKGYGTGWHADWGTFDSYSVFGVDATEACCHCGKAGTWVIPAGRSPKDVVKNLADTSAPTAVPTASPTTARPTALPISSSLPLEEQELIVDLETDIQNAQGWLLPKSLEDEEIAEEIAEAVEEIFEDDPTTSPVFQRSPCEDSVADWVDAYGFSCADYEEKAFCTPEKGYGSGWQTEWGLFNVYSVDGVDATEACCMCGSLKVIIKTGTVTRVAKDGSIPSASSIPASNLEPPVVTEPEAIRKDKTEIQQHDVPGELASEKNENQINPQGSKLTPVPRPGATIDEMMAEDSAFQEELVKMKQELLLEKEMRELQNLKEALIVEREERELKDARIKQLENRATEEKIPGVKLVEDSEIAKPLIEQAFDFTDNDEETATTAATLSPTPAYVSPANVLDDTPAPTPNPSPVPVPTAIATSAPTVLEESIEDMIASDSGFQSELSNLRKNLVVEKEMRELEELKMTLALERAARERDQTLLQKWMEEQTEEQQQIDEEQQIDEDRPVESERFSVEDSVPPAVVSPSVEPEQTDSTSFPSEETPILEADGDDDAQPINSQEASSQGGSIEQIIATDARFQDELVNLKKALVLEKELREIQELKTSLALEKEAREHEAEIERQHSGSVQTTQTQNTGPCQDLESWKDSYGYTCTDYVENSFCTTDKNFGAGWEDDWGTFASYSVDGVDATDACCGCGSNRAPPVVKRPGRIPKVTEEVLPQQPVEVAQFEVRMESTDSTVASTPEITPSTAEVEVADVSIFEQLQGFDETSESDKVLEDLVIPDDAAVVEPAQVESLDSNDPAEFLMEEALVEPDEAAAIVQLMQEAFVVDPVHESIEEIIAKDSQFQEQLNNLRQALIEEKEQIELQDLKNQLLVAKGLREEREAFERAQTQKLMFQEQDGQDVSGSVDDVSAYGNADITEVNEVASDTEASQDREILDDVDVVMEVALALEPEAQVAPEKDDLPRIPTICQDVQGWVDSYDYSCEDYIENDFCTPDGGFGTGWKLTWRSFDLYGTDGVDATQACCSCGGGQEVEMPPEPRMRKQPPPPPPRQTATEPADKQMPMPLDVEEEIHELKDVIVNEIETREIDELKDEIVQEITTRESIIEISSSLNDSETGETQETEGSNSDEDDEDGVNIQESVEKMITKDASFQETMANMKKALVLEKEMRQMQEVKNALLMEKMAREREEAKEREALEHVEAIKLEEASGVETEEVTVQSEEEIVDNQQEQDMELLVETVEQMNAHEDLTEASENAPLSEEVIDGTCEDKIAGWKDTFGYTCAEYVENDYCTPQKTPGSGWEEDWGLLSEYAVNGVDATEACCKCGGEDVSKILKKKVRVPKVDVLITATTTSSVIPVDDDGVSLSQQNARTEPDAEVSPAEDSLQVMLLKELINIKEMLVKDKLEQSQSVVEDEIVVAEEMENQVEDQLEQILDSEVSTEVNDSLAVITVSEDKQDAETEEEQAETVQESDDPKLIALQAEYLKGINELKAALEHERELREKDELEFALARSSISVVSDDVIGSEDTKTEETTLSGVNTPEIDLTEEDIAIEEVRGEFEEVQGEESELRRQFNLLKDMLDQEKQKREELESRVDSVELAKLVGQEKDVSPAVKDLLSPTEKEQGNSSSASAEEQEPALEPESAVQDAHEVAQEIEAAQEPSNEQTEASQESVGDSEVALRKELSDLKAALAHEKEMNELIELKVQLDREKALRQQAETEFKMAENGVFPQADQEQEPEASPEELQLREEIQQLNDLKEAFAKEHAMREEAEAELAAAAIPSAGIASTEERAGTRDIAPSEQVVEEEAVPEKDQLQEKLEFELEELRQLKEALLLEREARREEQLRQEEEQSKKVAEAKEQEMLSRQQEELEMAKAVLEAQKLEEASELQHQEQKAEVMKALVEAQKEAQIDTEAEIAKEDKAQAEVVSAHEPSTQSALEEQLEAIRAELEAEKEMREQQRAQIDAALSTYAAKIQAVEAPVTVPAVSHSPSVFNIEVNRLQMLATARRGINSAVLAERSGQFGYAVVPPELTLGLGFPESHFNVTFDLFISMPAGCDGGGFIFNYARNSDCVGGPFAHCEGGSFALVSPRNWDLKNGASFILDGVAVPVSSLSPVEFFEHTTTMTVEFKQEKTRNLHSVHFYVDGVQKFWHQFYLSNEVLSNPLGRMEFAAVAGECDQTFEVSKLSFATNKETSIIDISSVDFLLSKDTRLNLWRNTMMNLKADVPVEEVPLNDNLVLPGNRLRKNSLMLLNARLTSPETSSNSAIFFYAGILGMAVFIQFAVRLTFSRRERSSYMQV